MLRREEIRNLHSILICQHFLRCCIFPRNCTDLCDEIDSSVWIRRSEDVLLGQVVSGYHLEPQQLCPLG
jgi:hypothetical protein